MKLSRVVIGGIVMFSTFYLCIIVLSAGSKWQVMPAGWVNSKNGASISHFKQKNWDGLPISSTNFLYVKVNNETFNKSWDLEQILLQMDFSTQEWISLFDRYLPEIGFNGIMNSLSEAFNKLDYEDSHTLHSLGEYIAKKSNNNPVYAIEVSARDILHKAPLHGVVWHFVSNFPHPENFQELFSFIDSKLCYFNQNKNFYSLWISCAHGVGHGLAKLYTLDDIGNAMKVCGYHKDHDFIYACATGVIMELGEDSRFLLDSPEPCDSLVQFPAACYRFKYNYFRSFKGKYPCDGVADEYHARACLFGEGYTSEQQNVCWKYNPNHNPELLADEDKAWNHFICCMDGVWQTNSHMSPSACELFENTPAYDACLFRINDSSKWNWGLLENS